MKATISISILFQVMLVGVLPVTSVALHSLGLISIRNMVIPNLLLLALCAYHHWQNHELKKTMIQGWLVGILAVFLYDLARIPFIYAGWDDFIPSLGGWIVGEERNFMIGYLWRYLGNGAGLGLGFAVLTRFFDCKKMVLSGFVYGVSVFLCLDLLLIFSENAQELMFKVSPLTFIGGLTGHIVYGLTLGVVIKKLRCEKASSKQEEAIQ